MESTGACWYLWNQQEPAGTYGINRSLLVPMESTGACWYLYFLLLSLLLYDTPERVVVFLRGLKGSLFYAKLVVGTK